jgi:uncharacterized membrane-anchored protein YhcB (DUF1043 family)
MDERLTTAIMGLVGLILGLIIRDWVLQLHFFRKKREAELEDQFKQRQVELERIYRAELIGARDVVRLYADPLLRSAKSLNYRLQEVLE